MGGVLTGEEAPRAIRAPGRAMRALRLVIFAPRDPTADALADKPFRRKVVWRLPQALQPRPRWQGRA